MDLKAALNSKTVAELRKLAASYNVAGRSTMKKSELVDVLAHDGLAELSIAIEQITPEQQAAYAEQYNAANAKHDVVGDSVAAMIDQDAPERIRFDDEAAEIEAALDRDVEAGTYSYTNEVAVLRDAPGRAIVTAAFDGRTVGGSIERRDKRLVCRAEGVRVTGTTFEQVAKRLAKALGFHADRIDVARSF